MIMHGQTLAVVCAQGNSNSKTTDDEGDGVDAVQLFRLVMLRFPPPETVQSEAVSDLCSGLIVKGTANNGTLTAIPLVCCCDGSSIWNSLSVHIVTAFIIGQ